MGSDENVDARAALGVRPGHRPGHLKLQIDPTPKLSTSSRHPGNDSISPSIANAFSSHGLSGGRHGYNAKASNADASTSKAGFRRMRRPTLARRANAMGSTSSRGQYETQKLLSHLLDRLESRASPPDLLDRAAVASRYSTGKVKVKGKRHVVQIGKAIASVTHIPVNEHHTSHGTNSLPVASAAGVANYHLLDEGEWYTDDACDLVEQVRDILNLAEKQHLDIFGLSHLAAVEAASSSSHKPPSSLPSPSTAAPRNTADLFDSTVTVSGPTLLKRLVDMITSLLNDDCIHTTVRFSLLRPPYALQALCLDVATILYHKGDTDTQVTLMDSVAMSLYGLGDAFQQRVCEWLEGRVSEQLKQLAEERSAAKTISSPAVEWNDPFKSQTEAVSPAVPTFAISADPEDGESTQPQSSGWIRFSPTGRAFTTSVAEEVSGILSTHDVAGEASSTALRIAAVISRILVVLAATIDPINATLTTVYRVHRLLSLILTAKPDMSLDLLEMVAIGPSTIAKRGLEILTSFYPEAMGHNSIARRPALSTYSSHLSKWETGQERVLARDDTEGHSWIPWKADERQPPICYSCHQECLAFCVRCSMCGDTKHVDCLKLYRDELMECHVMDSYTGTRQSTRLLFSKRVCRVDELVLGGGSANGTAESTSRKVGKHRLHLVNLFTLTLCAECKDPLWGTTSQGYACMGLCQQFFHSACVESLASRVAQPGSSAGLCLPGFDIQVDTADPTKRDRFVITIDDLSASLERSASHSRLDDESIRRLSYDEATLVYSQLWIQREILLKGIANKSVKFNTTVDIRMKDPSGLSETLLKVREHLHHSNLSASSALQNFARVERHSGEQNHDWLWSPRYLQYCASLLRSPASTPGRGSAAPPPLLTVQSLTQNSASSESDPPGMTYEALDMPTIRKVLASDFQLRNQSAASLLLEQLRLLGLCGVPYCKTVDDHALGSDHRLVTFALPNLMDSSPAAEILILAIEQLLDDIDLSANEQGLRLLCKQAWPSSMCSSHYLERLGGAVMSWIMAEDDVLHHIVKNYASKGKRLPGVRSSAKDTAAVATYKDDRSLLLMRHAHAWLEALHNLDAAAYAKLAYERSKIIDDRWEVVELAQGEEAGPQAANLALERLTSLADAHVSFSVALDLVIAWLDDVGGIAREDVVYKSLPRLLRHTEDVLHTQRDLWEHAQGTSAQNEDGVRRVCRWLRVAACSGVEVPWVVITNLLSPSGIIEASNEACSDLVTAISMNATTIDHADLISTCNLVLTRTISSTVERNEPAKQSQAPQDERTQLLKKCMIMVLQAYGTLAEEIDTTSLATADYRRQAKIHAKRNPSSITRYTKVSLSVDAVVSAAALLRSSDYPAQMTLDFLWLLFAKTPRADNVDGFLHHVCPELYEAIWPLYDERLDRRSRARVFLKLVTINVIPIERMVSRQMESDREVVRERLLTFSLELADNSVTCDVTGWKRSCTGLLLRLLSHILDPSVYDAQNLVAWRALLPSPLQSISLCFEDLLLFGSDEQRMVLLAQLLHLQQFRPSWRIIGWNVVEEIVTEQLSTIQQFEATKNKQAQTAYSDAWSVRASTLALGLYMLAAGVSCEWKVVQRFQQHVAAACALPWPTPHHAITGVLLPALRQVLDSVSRVTIHNAQVEDRRSTRTALIGSQFVPVVMSFAAELPKRDTMVQRLILDVFLVVFYKHNVHAVELAALSALESVALYALHCPNVQNAIMALQVLRTAQNRMAADRFSRVLPQLFVLVADILVQALDNDGDSALIESARTFLQDSLHNFGKLGLVLQVLRVNGLHSERQRPPDSVARALSAAECGSSDDETSPSWLDLLFHDLSDIPRWNRERVGHVLVSLDSLASRRREPISVENATAFGTFLSRLAKQAGEWDSPSSFDPKYTLHISAMLLELCPPESLGTLLHQVAIFLQLVLSRFEVGLESLDTLVAVSLRLGQIHQGNGIVTQIFETASAGLGGLPIPPVSMTTLLWFISGSKAAKPFPSLEKDRDDIALDASSGCFGILTRSHPVAVAAMSSADSTMELLNAAATVIIRAEVASSGDLGLALRTLPSEASITQLEVLNHVLYASLETTLGLGRSNLISLYPIMARAASLSMFACSDLLSAAETKNDGAYFAQTVSVALRLSILAARDPEEPQDSTQFFHEGLASFWRRVWPDWDRLVRLAVAPSCVNFSLQAVVLRVAEDTVTFVSQTWPLLLVESAPLINRGLQLIEEFRQSRDATRRPPTSMPDKAYHKPVSSSGRPGLTSGVSAVSKPGNYWRGAVQTVWNDITAAERQLAASRRRNGRDTDHDRDRDAAHTRIPFRA